MTSVMSLLQIVHSTLYSNHTYISICQLYHTLSHTVIIHLFLINGDTKCTFFNNSQPNAKVLVSVVMDGGAVGSITGTMEVIVNRGGHSDRSTG